MNLSYFEKIVFFIQRRLRGILFFAIVILIFSQKVALAQEKITVSVLTGYQQEDFRWSIAGELYGNDVNVLSEVIWKNLNGPRIDIGLKGNVWKGLVTQINFSKAFITSGTVTDSDYAENDRASRVYYDLFNSDRGSTTSVELMLGYHLFKQKKFSIISSIGYVTNLQNLWILDRNGNTSGQLKSTYKTHWQGMIIALEGRLKTGNKFSIEPIIKYSQSKYYGEANWNLIPEFQHPVSFTHSANGFSFDSTLKTRYRFSSLWSVFLAGNYVFWDTGKGIDKLYKATGEIVYAQLNGVKRSGYGFNVGVTKSFNF